MQGLKEEQLKAQNLKKIKEFGKFTPAQAKQKLE